MAYEAYLLDTNIANAPGHEGHRLHQEVRAWLEDIEDEAVFVSAVSLAECEYGLNIFPLSSQAQLEMRNLMKTYQILPIDHHTAEIYGKIRAALFNAYAPRDRRNRVAKSYIEDLRERTTGKELQIQENDLWIVSTAIQYNLILVTDDRGGGMRNIVEEAHYADRTKFWAEDSSR